MFKSIIFSFVLLFNLSAFAARVELKNDLKKKIQKVLNLNEELHAAFFEYNGNAVESAAKKMIETVKDIKDKKISTDLKDSLSGLQKISSKQDEKSNKEAFFEVSQSLVKIIQQYEIGGKWNVYSCPMVKKTWIQDSAKHDGVRNPYAPEMPECGSKKTNF